MGDFKEWLSDNLRYFLVGVVVILIIGGSILGLKIYSSKVNGNSDPAVIRKNTEAQTETGKETETKKQTEKETKKQTEKETKKQTEKETKKQTENMGIMLPVRFYFSPVQVNILLYYETVLLKHLLKVYLRFLLSVFPALLQLQSNLFHSLQDYE